LIIDVTSWAGVAAAGATLAGAVSGTAPVAVESDIVGYVGIALYNSSKICVVANALQRLESLEK
jgi:hypothetical protein